MKRRSRRLISLFGTLVVMGVASLWWKEPNSARSRSRTAATARQAPPRTKSQPARGIWPPALSSGEERFLEDHSDLRTLLELCRKAQREVKPSAEELSFFNQLSPEDCRLLMLKLCGEPDGPPPWLFEQTGLQHPAEFALLLTEIQSHPGPWSTGAAWAYSFKLGAAGLARKDPSLAIDWVDGFNASFPENALFPILQLSAVDGMSSTDPRLAFETSARWNIDERAAAREILANARTLEEKAEAYRALSEHVAVEEDPGRADDLLQSGLSGLAQGLSTERLDTRAAPKADSDRSFEEVTTWLDRMNFGPDDLQTIAEHFTGPDHIEDFPKWEIWMNDRGYDQAAKRLRFNESIANLVSSNPRP